MPPAALHVTQVMLISAALYCAALLLVSLLIVRSGHKPHPGEVVPKPEEMSRHLVGMYYCNADDPRGWVPKSGDPKRSNGYTINMRYRSWVTAYNAIFAGGLIGIALIGAAAPFLLTK